MQNFCIPEDDQEARVENISNKYSITELYVLYLCQYLIFP